ncbi:hypothetical protein [Tahibacter harae]|uniref:Uncharacterized protein n=1 Tax=Tahibacter harae TaxID=2963937 RepID=A0ABT1QQI9_9GAMM|nr:hypothetical protein [Tahibacter harae]MCQ4164546.1 hypothetical protein [Tahibacter harae]
MRENIFLRLLVLLLLSGAAQAELRLDPGFGSGGSLVVAASGSRDDRPLLAGLADGRFVVANMAVADVPTVRVARYLADGRLDSGFGNHGVSQVVVAAEHWDTSLVASLKVRSDGGLWLAVTRKSFLGSPPAYSHTLVRLGPDGNPVPGFNGGAALPLPALGSPDNGPLEEMLLQDDAVLLLASIYTAPPQGRFKALRIRADGTPDPGFGVAGLLIAERAGAFSYSWMSVPGGGFQALYTIFNPPELPRQSFWRRYRGDGSLDLTFGSAGEQAVAPGAGRYVANLFALPGGHHLGQGLGCHLFLFDSQGQLLREFESCPGRELIAAQPLGDKLLLVGQDFFGGTPPPGSPLSLRLVDGSGNPVPGFSGEVEGGLPGLYDDRFAAITDRAGRILIGHADNDAIRLYRYQEVGAVASSAVPVPALGAAGLILLLLGLLLPVRRRLRPG